MNLENIKPEMRLTWAYVPRGGNGQPIYVSVEVVSVGEKKVTVRAPLRRGGTKLTNVWPSRLLGRST